jgi:glycosyltransferase involved in cell wall biosynthesis
MKLDTDLKATAVVVTTVSEWDEPPRMRHHVSKQLTRFSPVIYIQLYSKGQQSITYDKASNIYLVKLGGYLSGIYRIRLLRLTFNYYQILRIRRLLKNMEFHNYILLNFQYDFSAIKYLKKTCKLLLGFINDDFVNIDPFVSERVKANKHLDLVNTLQSCDHVLVSAEILGRYATEANKSFTCTMSGHDFPVDFEDVKPSSDPNRSIKVCFMGYVDGNLNYDWISDALQHQSIRINFIGPVQKNDFLLSFVNKQNFKLHSPLVGLDLYNFLQSQDILIMPYAPLINNDMSTAPAKLFQYLAVGRPIVSSVLPNLIDLPDGFITQVTSASGFTHALLAAAQEDSIELRVARRKFAASHTWDSRGNDIWRLISNMM